MQLSWSHALFRVHDFDAMVDFYTTLLGFQITDRGEIGDSQVVFMSQNATDHHQMALVSGRSEKPEAGDHFAFRVDTLQDVKAWHRKLTDDNRVAGTRPMSHGNAWSVYFQDPDGNGIEIFCDTPWHVEQPHGHAWDPAASDDEIHAATRKVVEASDSYQPIEAYYATRAEALKGAQT